MSQSKGLKISPGYLSVLTLWQGHDLILRGVFGAIGLGSGRRKLVIGRALTTGAAAKCVLQAQENHDREDKKEECVDVEPVAHRKSTSLVTAEGRAFDSV